MHKVEQDSINHLKKYRWLNGEKKVILSLKTQGAREKPVYKIYYTLTFESSETISASFTIVPNIYIYMNIVLIKFIVSSQLESGINTLFFNRLEL